MSEARQRVNAIPAPSAPSAAASSKQGEQNGAAPANVTRSPKKDSFGVTDILRILGGLLLLNCALSWFVTNESVTWGWRPWFSKPTNLKAWMTGPIRLTDLELASYNGQDPSKPIYVGLNGTIYDVSAGRHLYGPGGSYSFFAGRDATRAFVTGCFDTDLTPDLRGAEETYVPVDPEGWVETLTPAEQKVRREREYRKARETVQAAVEGWAKMFRGDGGKAYFKVGEIKRGKGWIEMLPKRKLCERAQKQRPKRKIEKN